MHLVTFATRVCKRLNVDTMIGMFSYHTIYCTASRWINAPEKHLDCLALFAHNR